MHARCSQHMVNLFECLFSFEKAMLSSPEDPKILNLYSSGCNSE
jgi:hypothetical protein